MSNEVVDSIKIENGKYEIKLFNSGELYVYRHGELYLDNPLGPKMLIAMMYELIDSRKLLSDIAFDFDPDKSLGPKCGPETLSEIVKYAGQYNFDLRCPKS